MKRKIPISALLIGVLFLSLIVRLALLGFFIKEGSVETFEYNEIAKNMISGKGYIYDHLGTAYKSFAPPLYAMLIALIFKVAGINIAPVLCIQVVLSLSTCLAIYFIARRIGSKIVCFLAFFLCAFHPGLIIYSVKKVHSLNLDAFLFAMTILFVMKLKAHFSLRGSIFVGLKFGLTMLSRPSILVFLPVALFWLALEWKVPVRQKVLAFLCMACVLALPVSFWATRNYIIHKEYVPITTTDAEVFWRGNNPNATGASYGSDKTAVIKSDKILYGKLRSRDELGKRRLFRKESIKFIRENPGRFLALYFRKLYYFWWFSPVSGLLYPGYYFLAYRIFYSVIVISALIGLTYLLTGGNIEVCNKTYLLLLFIVCISLFQALFYVEGRHRWCVEPVLIIFSSVGIAGIGGRIWRIYR